MTADDEAPPAAMPARLLFLALAAGKSITVAELEFVLDDVEGRGYGRALAALQDGERIAKWLGLKATGERSQRGAISYLRPAVEYLEAIEGDDR